MYDCVQQLRAGQMLTARDRDFEPTVSIIVPVRNGEATIATLLESLAKLNYSKEKLDFLVIDGNSTDNTGEIVSGIQSG